MDTRKKKVILSAAIVLAVIGLAVIGTLFYKLHQVQSGMGLLVGQTNKNTQDIQAIVNFIKQATSQAQQPAPVPTPPQTPVAPTTPTPANPPR
jgi:hypothetical protein